MYSAYSSLIIFFTETVTTHRGDLFVSYLRVQIQVCELSFADGCDCVTVHGEVHLSTLALDGDIVPVQIVKKAASSQCRPTVNFVYYTTSWEKKRPRTGGNKHLKY